MALLDPSEQPMSFKRQHETFTIKHLPKELLIDVLVRVSSVAEDLGNAKLTCKDFAIAASHGSVMKRASLGRLPLNILELKESDGSKKFFDVCKENGNVEALFRQGLFEYFSIRGDHNLGFEYFKIAAEKGKILAEYLCHIITGESKMIPMGTAEVCNRLITSYIRSLMINKERISEVGLSCWQASWRAFWSYIFSGIIN